MVKQFLSVLVLAYFLCPGSCQYYSESDRRKLCGFQLTDALSTLCKGVYVQILKKSQNPLLSADYLHQASGDAPTYMDHLYRMPYPFLAKSKSSNFLKTRLKRSEGIADECCREKTCTLDELLDYCGPV